MVHGYDTGACPEFVWIPGIQYKMGKIVLTGQGEDETIRRLRHDVYPCIGDLTFPQLYPLKILEIKVLKRIIERGALSVVKRLKPDFNQIFRSARKKKLIQYDLIEDIELQKPQNGNFAVVTRATALHQLFIVYLYSFDTNSLFLTYFTIDNNNAKNENNYH